MIKIPKPSHPSPDRFRAGWLNLNGEWDFSFDTPIYDKRIVVPFSWCAPASGIADPRAGSAYYRKKVFFSPEDGRLFLIFGAVDYECTVYVNGAEVGSHRGGYQRFEFDVTEFWHPTEENEIVVYATDEDKPYQTYGKQGYGNIRGIWQTVYLERRAPVYIDRFRIETRISGEVTIAMTAAGDGVAELFEAEFEDVYAKSEDSTLTLSFPNPKLWSPEKPYLYAGVIRILGRDKNGRRTVDTVNTYFGIREIGKIEMNGKTPTLTLNGKPIYLNGTLDQSFNTEGYFTYPTDEECEKEILRLKALGLNMVRFHIKPEEPLKIFFADKLGMLVMEDMPNFWGEPTETARKYFEEQMEETMARDINHPSVFYWVIFNETWGLFSKSENGEDVYRKDTQRWVEKCYRRAKEIDPSRPVEDNSPCKYDHTVTDVNTWHFYINGYQPVKEHIAKIVSETVDGATLNYAEGYCHQPGTPLLNSECGNYWGVKEGAGASDISWYYKYMLNEFRLHEKIGGFIFTEFHDVVNEFNGYYLLDGGQKIFGYEGYVPGMSIVDLHAQDFLAVDHPPMLDIKGGDAVAIPLSISSFTDRNHGKEMKVRWELIHRDTFGTERNVRGGYISVSYCRFGVTALGGLHTEMPREDGLAILRLYLETAEGTVVMRNFVVFNVHGVKADTLSLPVASLRWEGFTRAWTLQKDAKLCLIGDGAAYAVIKKADIPGYREGRGIEIFFEASAREPLAHDFPDNVLGESNDLTFMLGGERTRGVIPSSCYMTDDVLYPASINLWAGELDLGTFRLPDAPADSRGALSWNSQEESTLATTVLEDAGSYGYLCHATISPEEAAALPEVFPISFEPTAGAALYGRESGRFPCNIEILAK